jgi:hypothetical protein
MTKRTWGCNEIFWDKMLFLCFSADFRDEEQQTKKMSRSVNLQTDSKKMELFVFTISK